MEDDDFQRRMVAGMLRSLGAKLICDACDGQQAIEIIRREHETSVDIVVCGLNMPGMDDLEFLRHLGEEHHNVAVILISALPV